MAGHAHNLTWAPPYHEYLGPTEATCLALHHINMHACPDHQPTNPVHCSQPCRSAKALILATCQGLHNAD